LDTLEVTSLFVAGHDFGGPVALTMMQLFPELVIKGLVLSQTNVFTDTPIPLPLQVARIPLIGTPAFWLMIGNLPALYMTYMAAVRQKESLSWSKFRRHLTPHGITLTRRIFQRSLADLPTNYDTVQAFLSQISCPTLVLWAANDPFFSVAIGERVQGAIGASKLVIFEQTGHFVPEERPEQVVEAIAKFFGT
jgi:pimeloyl-ACP methyl ester carboxylesterase